MTALLDTSFLFAIASSKDRNHSRVLEVARTLNDPLMLPVTVIPEVCYLIASRLGHMSMRRFLSELVASNIIVEPIIFDDIERAVKILNQYADSQLDFVDASIVAVAERHNISRILTLDRRDFSIIHPQHCRYFDILP